MIEIEIGIGNNESSRSKPEKYSLWQLALTWHTPHQRILVFCFFDKGN